MSAVSTLFVSLCLLHACLLIQEGICWNSISEAQEELWGQFTEAELKSVSASMILSRSVQTTTKKLYKTADMAEKLAAKIKIQLFNNSHSIMLHSIAASRCLEGLQLSLIVKDLNNAVLPAQRCLHDFADIGASLEKEISRIVVLMRAFIWEGKRSIKQCQQGNNDNSTTINKPCIERIMKELKHSIDLFMNKINAIKDYGIAKNNRVTPIIKSCLRRLRKQIARVKTVQKDVLKCKD